MRRSTSAHARQLARDLERMTLLLELHVEVSQLLMASEGLESIFAKVLEKVTLALGGERARFLRYDPSHASMVTIGATEGTMPVHERVAPLRWLENSAHEPPPIELFQVLPADGGSGGTVRLTLKPGLSCEINLGGADGEERAVFLLAAHQHLYGMIVVHGIDTSITSPLDVKYFDVLANLLALGLRNAMTLEETERLATRDGLTGVFNHLYFQEFLDWALHRSSRERHPLVLVMLDIDDFKKVNDRFGHPTGDEVLCRLAESLQNGLRKSDMVARYGGEEFVVVLPATTAKRAQQLMDRIAKTVRHGVEFEEAPDYVITVSCGIAEWEAQEPISKRELIARADQAMYYGKRHGKNCTIIWTPVLMAGMETEQRTSEA
ncbi:MAG: GGDEF domain-containing protein [Candidatus Tectomicrobia bacterium]|nr:GGDEF domain-containing protein [Candidatus Tectomicrobia bacterium]